MTAYEPLPAVEAYYYSGLGHWNIATVTHNYLIAQNINHRRLHDQRVRNRRGHGGKLLWPPSSYLPRDVG